MASVDGVGTIQWGNRFIHIEFISQTCTESKGQSYKRYQEMDRNTHHGTIEHPTVSYRFCSRMCHCLHHEFGHRLWAPLGWHILFDNRRQGLGIIVINAKDGENWGRQISNNLQGESQIDVSAPTCSRTKQGTNWKGHRVIERRCLAVKSSRGWRTRHML